MDRRCGIRRDRAHSRIRLRNEFEYCVQYRHAAGLDDGRRHDRAPAGPAARIERDAVDAEPEHAAQSEQWWSGSLMTLVPQPRLPPTGVAALSGPANANPEN